jgi:hypothetical protein
MLLAHRGDAQLSASVRIYVPELSGGVGDRVAVWSSCFKAFNAG